MGKKKANAAGKKGRDSMVVGSKVKAYVKSKGMKCGGELPEALSHELYHLIDKAAHRARENKRGTVQPRDL